MNINLKNLAFWAFMFFALIQISQMLEPKNETSVRLETVSYTEFVQNMQNGQMQEVTLQGDKLIGESDGGLTRYESRQPENSNISEIALEENIPLNVESPEGPGFLGVLLSFLPMLLFIGFFLFIMNRMQGGGAIGKFGQSKAKLLNEQGTVTFQEVAGIDEAKEELEEIVDFLRDPSRYTALGAKIPKGALLVGPPGTGKTLLARAIAGEAGVPFFSISGSDFVEMFVGVGASRMRDMFEQAKRNAPCIVFIDEIDAVGRARGVGVGGGNDEREQTLNQMLVEMDGFEANEGVIIIAATNRPDVLDPALLRPGRFDRQVQVSAPDVKGREAILNVHARKVPLAPSVDLRIMARGTPGFSGAELANLVNEAALMAARTRKNFIDMFDFEKAKDKIMLGTERRSLIMTAEEKELTAYHEAGHALVGYYSPEHDPIHKATIVPRDRALGLVLSLPERDTVSVNITKYKSILAMAMAGRVAEEIIFGEDKVTSGASSDIEKVTNIARAMVTKFGFSKLGNINYSNEKESYLGTQGGGLNASEQTQREIEEEVKRLVDDATETAREMLTEKKEEFINLAKALIEHETLTGPQIAQALAGDTPQEKVKKPSLLSGLPKTKTKHTGGAVGPAVSG